jgi:hypothetical protein
MLETTTTVARSQSVAIQQGDFHMYVRKPYPVHRASVPLANPLVTESDTTTVASEFSEKNAESATTTTESGITSAVKLMQPTKAPPSI